MDIQLQHITKRFKSLDKKNRTETVAVNDFSLTIPDGELVGLLGPSGCGKSTILNMISGLEAPSEGKIFFGNEDVTELPVQKRGVGLVFQSYALYPHMTVLQNILFPLQNMPKAVRPDKKEMLKKAQEAAKIVEMTDYLSRKPSQLSGGQQQRVAIARALVRTPKVLLLDEPLSNLDARLRLQTREELRRIQRQTGITTVFVTHDQEEAMSICDRIAVIQKGSLMQTGSPQEVYESPVNRFTAEFLGNPPINLFHATVQNGMLYLGEHPVMPFRSVNNGDEVTVGIRPEGFTPAPNGVFPCQVKEVQVRGRDICLLASSKACQTEVFRVILQSSDAIRELNQTVFLNIKPEKLYVFDKNGERVMPL